MFFYLLLGFGIIIRLFLIPLPGFTADMAFWKGWGLAVADKGIMWLVQNTNYNYPPGFTYILWLINKIYALFKSPYDVTDYWSQNNLAYLFLFKLLIFASDVLVVFLIIKIAQKLKSKWGKLLAIVYFLNPATLFDGVWWGQVDQFGLALFLSAFYFLLSEGIVLASILFTLSCLMKFQNIIFIPLFFLFIYKKYPWPKFIDSLKVSFITFLIICLPFFFSRNIMSLIHLLTMNSDYFPLYSLNAFNIWWVLAGLKGMMVSDKKLLIGIMSAKDISFLLFVFGYFIATVTLFFSKKENLFYRFLLSCSMAIFSFFHLMTQSHDRYLFHLVGFLPLLILFVHDKKKLSIFYILFSIFFFLNIYLSMWFNYPEQLIWPFGVDATSVITLIISLAQIGLFLYFIFVYILPEIKQQLKIIVVFGLVLFTLVIFKNKDYLLKKEISLTTIKPIDFKQDYLYPVINKNLNSQGNIFAFGRLSSNYFFYNKGIASHVSSTINYDLGKRFSQFKTDYGLDTEAVATAKAIFVIEGDGKEIFRSKEKGRFDDPSTITVNIKGVNKLTLKMEKVGSIYGAHADWLNPVLVR